MAAPPKTLADLLKDSPKNWGKWGEADEVGALNYLGADEAMHGVRSVRSGKTFTLQAPMCAPAGDPIWPGRPRAQRFNTIDEGYFLAGKVEDTGAGPKGCDDVIVCALQGSTQYDALGHAWLGDKIWNGYDSKTTIGSMTRASILPIAEKGIVGRGLLLDVARLRGKDSLERGETFTHEDLMLAAERQGSPIQKRDILLVHTGWVGLFYRDREAFYSTEGWIEPGLTYSAELIDWFNSMEIPNLVTDTLANEVTVDPDSGIMLPLHVALMSNLGVTFTEIASLDALADDCASDNQYDFLYAAAPLKVAGAAGSPVNPVVIK
jgi:kynurenine formamidase